MHLTPEKREYVKDFIKSAWNEYETSGYRYFYNNRESIGEIRSYMNGSIDPTKYQDIIIPKELANEDETWQNINWKPLDIYSKYRRICFQIAMAMKEEMSIDIVDAMGMDEKNEFFSEVAAQIYLRDQMLDQGYDPQLIGIDPELPESQKELEMYMQFSFKHVAAVEFETILDLIKKNNNWKEIYKQLVYDLHDLGVAITKDYEEEDGEIFLEYVNPEFFFCSYFEENDGSDLDYAGEVERMTVPEMKRLANCDQDREEIFALEKIMQLDHMPNDKELKIKRKRLGEHQDLSSKHLNVVRMEFISGETETFEIRTTKDGVRVFGKESNGKKNKEYETGEFDVIYQGYYVLGTDCYFGIEKKENILRDPSDVKRAKLSYSLYVPEMHGLRINSIGKQVMPSIDAMNLAWYKLQNAILRSRPKGVAYDLSSLEAVPMGASGLTPEQNIARYMASGNLAIRAVDEDGNLQRLPIQELAGGMGAEGQEFMQQIQFNENLIRSLTGLNELVDGSTPNPKTLKSVAQQAQVASNNAIKHIHDGVQMVEISTSVNVIQRIQDQAESDDIEFYAPAIGSNSVEFFKITKDHSMRSLGLSFVPQPTPEEEERFQQSLQLALSTPEGGKAQITIAQKTMLEQITNKKYAQMYLSYIVERNLVEAERKQMAMMQQKSELDAAAAERAEAAKQQTLQMQAQIDAMLLDKEYGYKMQIAQIDANSGITQDQIKADSRDRESARMNETKMAIEQAKASDSQQPAE